jgi:hypothetical protein
MAHGSGLGQLLLLLQERPLLARIDTSTSVAIARSSIVVILLPPRRGVRSPFLRAFHQSDDMSRSVQPAEIVCFRMLLALRCPSDELAIFDCAPSRTRTDTGRI